MSTRRKHWASASLAEVSQKIGSGATPRGGAESYHPKGIPLIRSMNVHFDGVRREGLVYLDDEQAAGLESVAVSVGDVLLNITGASIGRVSVAPEWAAGARVNQHVAIIRLRDPVEPRYVAAWLSSPEMQRHIGAENYGVTRPALTKGMIEDLQVPIPPLAEQRRIVAILDRAMARTARARADFARIRALIAQYKRAILLQAFEGDLTTDWRHDVGGTDWSNAFLADLVTEGPTNGWSPPSGNDASGALSLKLTATTSGQLRLDEGAVKRIYETPAPDSPYWLTPGDLLIQRANSLEHVGASAIFEGPAQRYIYPDLMMRVRVTESTTRHYLWRYLNSEHARRYFRANATGTAGNMPKINGRTVRALPVPLPSLEEQGEIVRRIEAAFVWLDKVAQEQAQASRLLDRLDEALLAKAFRGELVPQNPAEEPADELLARIKAERADPTVRKRRTAACDAGV